MNVGVLAFQGDVREHHEALKSLNVRSCDVRSADDLHHVDALIMPGGESTVISRFLTETKLRPLLIDLAKEGLPIYGTCAGAILLSEDIVGDDRLEPLKILSIAVSRNAYGRQSESFTERIPFGDQKDINAVFIRAPKIIRVGPGVEVLSALRGDPVLVKQGNILASTFHPELSETPSRIHAYFLSLIR